MTVQTPAMFLGGDFPSCAEVAEAALLPRGQRGRALPSSQSILPARTVFLLPQSFSAGKIWERGRGGEGEVYKNTYCHII